MPSNISVDIGSSSDSSTESNKFDYSKLSSGGMIESSLDFSSLSSLLSASSQVSDNKSPSSKCVNVITSPACYFEDVAQGMYDTSGRIATPSA